MSLGDTMKASKTITTKKRRIKMTKVVVDKDVDVVEDWNIDTDIAAAIAKKRKEAQEGILWAKPKTTALKKHIAVKRKAFEGPGPLRESLEEEESGSVTKGRKCRKKRSLFLG